ncbi:alpha/beta hydrolase family protein [Steroidobacter flavus]|uniref:Alpha/beta hydrolase family protein n=1 Tax=Steroidobacter flavus TaxID=1842136 RepID=A0ABV8T0C3_9GAMM
MERKNIRRRWAIGLGLLVLAAGAHAQTNPYQKGPDPTSASLNATSGPFSVATSSVSSLGAVGFGGGTIYYPTATGTYAVLAICPGFTATQSSIAWLARRIATHGFVVITIDTNTTLDQPPSRATQLMAALNYVTNSSSAAVRAKVDASRRGVAGHSMGGGGTLYAARDNPSLKAAVPLTAWSTLKSFSSMQVPTLVVGAEADTIAPVASHSIPFYNSLSDSLDKAYAELNGGTHFAPNSTSTPIGRYSVAWVKRFMDNDTRYTPFLCGAPHQSYATALVFSDYRSTCPY